MVFAVVFFLVLIGSLIGIYVYKYFDSDTYFLKKCNSVCDGMTKENVIAIMGQKFSYSKNEDGTESLEWRKVRNGKMVDNGSIKGRPTLFGAKATMSSTTSIQTGYTISFCVIFKDDCVSSFSTQTLNN